MQSCLEFGFVPAPGGAPLPGEQVNRVKTRNHGRLLPVWLVASVVLGLAVAWFARPARRPNVLLLTVDTLRADRLGCYGSRTTSTPAVDRLAESGVLFENDAAPMPMTRPSLFSIFTSRYPREHGAVNNSVPLPDRSPVLAERFQEAGYATGAFVGVQILSPESGAARGFDVFKYPAHARDVPADQVVPGAIEWMSTVAAKRPFFAWVHLFDPHIPYRRHARPGEPAQAASGSPPLAKISWSFLQSVAEQNSGDVPQETLDTAIRFYGGEVEYADRWIEALVGFLASHSTLDDTVVAFTADHGECFDHNVFFEHTDCPYEGAIHVPLILRYPRKLPGGVRVTRPVEHLDLAPTLLALAGIGPPATFEGESLLDSIGNRGGRVRSSFFQLPLYQERAIRGRGTRYGKIRSVAGKPVRPVVFERQLVGVRDGSWKYILDDGGEELYALGTDPLETHNLASRETEVAARLKAEIEQRLAAHPLDLPNPSMVNQRLRATLRALGYTD